MPQRIPAKVRDRRPCVETFAADMRLHLHRGRRFDLTVTDVDLVERTVDGIEAVTTSKVGLPLTDEQAQALGLAEDGYSIEGLVYDADHQLVKLPATLAYTGLPIRWLDPLGTPTVLGDDSAAYYRWRVREDATGLELSLIAHEARAVLEKQREVAARALDDYDAEAHLRILEVQLSEWQRVELVMRVSAADGYRPEDDPEVSEAELHDPFRQRD
ncbi:hypothetical protein AB0G73_23925 [Streptomyces sp. NPDC020719]|uniref:hypothetical protein n=1 Tax=Streptomyces sp. NPDC020719 TaxID=3154896 RepID=UPI00340BC2F0